MLLKDQGPSAPSLPEWLHHIFHCDSEWHHPLPHPAAARGQGGPAALHLLCELNLLGKLSRHWSMWWEKINSSILRGLKMAQKEERSEAWGGWEQHFKFTFSMAPGLAPAPHPMAGSEPSFLSLALLFSLPFPPYLWSQEHEPCLGLFAVFLSKKKEEKKKKRNRGKNLKLFNIPSGWVKLLTALQRFGNGLWANPVLLRGFPVCASLFSIHFHSKKRAQISSVE